MRPYLRTFVAKTNISGTSYRANCDGSTSFGPIASSGDPVLGVHKSPAVYGGYTYDTDYSCCWVNTHINGLAKWRSSDAIYCHDVVGFGPWPYYNPIYKSRPAYRNNIRPIFTTNYPLAAMSMNAPVLNETGVILPGTRWHIYKDIMTNSHLNKIKDQKAMALVSLGEAKESIGLVKSLTKDVTQSLLFIAKGIVQPKSLVDAYLRYAKKNGLRKPDRKAWSKMRSRERQFFNRMRGYYTKHPNKHKALLNGIPTTAAERWIQYRYGIGPLLADLSAAHDYVYTKWHEFIHTNHIITRYRENFEQRVQSYTGNDYVAVILGVSKVSCQFRSRYVITNSVARHLQKIGFSPSELASTAWELVPFSWMFDWFYNLGDFFSALSATVGLTHLQTSFSIKEIVDARILVNGTATNVPIEPMSGPDGKVEYGAFMRITQRTFPTPIAPTLTFPFEGIFHKRVFDSIALLFLAHKPKH